MGFSAAMGFTVAGPVRCPSGRLLTRSTREVINPLTLGYSQLDHDVASYKREESPPARDEEPISTRGLICRPPSGGSRGPAGSGRWRTGWRGAPPADGRGRTHAWGRRGRAVERWRRQGSAGARWQGARRVLAG